MPSGDWTDYAATSFASGSGTSSDPYQIATAEQLAYLAKCVNGSSTSLYRLKYFILTANIDLSAHYWIPIGYSSSYYFRGYFDGQCYSINNMTISSNQAYLGLFGYVYNNSGGQYIKKINLINPTISYTSTSASYIGCICGYSRSYSNFSDLYIENLSITKGTNIGGILGYTYSGSVTMSDIFINGGSINNGAYVGGAIGYVEDSVPTTVNCSNININSITGTSSVGGIVGHISSTVTVDSSSVSVATANSETQGYCAGIIGRRSDLTKKCAITNCVVNCWGGSSTDYVVSMSVSSGNCSNNYYNTEKVSTTRTGVSDSACTGLSFTSYLSTTAFRYKDSNTYLPVYRNTAYNLGTNWGTLDGNIVYLNNALKNKYPNIRPYYKILFADWENIFNDGFMQLHIITDESNFTFPYPLKYGYANVTMQSYVFDTKRTDGTASATGSYYSPGDVIYNIDQDYQINDISYASSQLISYQQSSGTTVDVENIYYKTTNGTLSTIINYQKK